MDIKIGELYENRTQRYLLPILLTYGESFQVKLNSIFNLAFGIHDTFLDGTEYEKQKLIYILCDKAFQKVKFDNFLNYVKHHEYFVMDYAFDDLEHGRKHMIVVKFPEDFYPAYDKFIEGKYSEMYNDAEIRFYIKPTSPIIQVLKRTNLMKSVFTKKLNKLYGTDITEKDVIEGEMEYDFPYNKSEEIFNYKYREQGES